MASASGSKLEISDLPRASPQNGISPSSSSVLSYNSDGREYRKRVSTSINTSITQTGLRSRKTAIPPIFQPIQHIQTSSSCSTPSPSPPPPPFTCLSKRRNHNIVDAPLSNRQQAQAVQPPSMPVSAVPGSAVIEDFSSAPLVRPSTRLPSISMYPSSMRKRRNSGGRNLPSLVDASHAAGRLPRPLGIEHVEGGKLHHDNIDHFQKEADLGPSSQGKSRRDSAHQLPSPRSSSSSTTSTSSSFSDHTHHVGLFSYLRREVNFPQINWQYFWLWNSITLLCTKIWKPQKLKDSQHELPPSSSPAFDSSAGAPDLFDSSQARQSLDNFLEVPFRLEKLLFYGFIICLQNFLFFFALLPLRIVVAVFSLTCRLFFSFFNSSKAISITHHHVCDLIRGAMVFWCYTCLGQLDYSQMYHEVRGESALKLYMVYNLLDVFDKLCCAFGQDIVDLTMDSASEMVQVCFSSSFPPSSSHQCAKCEEKINGNHAQDEESLATPQEVVRRLLGALFASAVYLALHSFVQFLQVVTLNVALNSTNNALFTLLVSANFVELKGSVFKRFSPDNLFQISCADVVERFSIAAQCILIALQNMRSAVMGEDELRGIAGVWLCEILIDWIKHAFVAKFNGVQADSYSMFQESLRVHIADSATGSPGMSLFERTQQICRRFGFMPFPLVALMLRVLIHAGPDLLQDFLSPNQMMLLAAALYVLVLILTLSLGRALLLMSSNPSGSGNSSPAIPSKRESLISMAKTMPAPKGQVPTVESLGKVSRYELKDGRVP